MAYPAAIEPVYESPSSDAANLRICKEYDQDNLSDGLSSGTYVSDYTVSAQGQGQVASISHVNVDHCSDFNFGTRNVNNFNGNVQVTLLVGRGSDEPSPDADDFEAVEAVRQAIGAPAARQLQEGAPDPNDPHAIPSKPVLKTSLRWTIGVTIVVLIASISAALAATLNSSSEIVETTEVPTTDPVPGSQCAGRDWQCADGQCINSAKRCDGRADCGDGSDEDARQCDQIPSIPLAVGQFLTVHLALSPADRGSPIEFQLCGSACAVGRVYGANASGALYFESLTACNGRGASCIEDAVAEPPNWQPFGSGDHVWVAMLSKTGLSVWRRGMEGRAVVGTNEGSNVTLRVRPQYWATDMPVEFNAVPCPTGEWQCANGKCIPPQQRCDGVRHCNDGSDEFQDDCARTLSVPLVEGQRITVSVQFSRQDHGKIMFIASGGLCGWLSVAGSNRTGALWYTGSGGCLDCSRRETFCDDVLLFAPPDPVPFASGALRFVVELRSSDVVAVWRPEFSAEVATVETFYEESTVLLVQPYSWVVDMPVHFEGVICGPKDLQCPRGQCISSEVRCDGFDDCGDGTDEIGCDAIPTVLIEEDEIVTAWVSLGEGHGWPVILACFERSCVRLDVKCSNSNGELWLQSQYGCNLRGGGCLEDQENEIVRPDNCENLTAGVYGFQIVQRMLDIDEDESWWFRALHLVLWLADAIADAYVSLVMNYGRSQFVHATAAPTLAIKVRPRYWATDMAVHFNDTPLPTRTAPTSATEGTSTTEGEALLFSPSEEP